MYEENKTIQIFSFNQNLHEKRAFFADIFPSFTGEFRQNTCGDEKRTNDD